MKETQTIAEAYQKELDSFEAKYFYPSPPSGFHKLLDARGNAVKGGAFYCPRCKLHVFAPGATVKHCGKVEKRPNWFKSLLLKSWRIRKPQ